MNFSSFHIGVSLISAITELLLIVALLIVLLHARRCRRERNDLRQEKEVVFGFVHDVAEVFADAASVDLDLLLKRVLFYALRTTRASAGALYLFEPHGAVLRVRAISGIFPPLIGGIDINLEKAVSKSQHVESLVKTRMIHRGEGLIGAVADFGAPILIEDAEPDPRVPQFEADFLKIRSILLVAMRFRQQVIGVLAVVNPVDGRPFSQADLNLLQSLADQASVSVHYAGMREELNEKQRMDNDLSIARRIQTALLPKQIPRIEGIELAAYNCPAMEIGGDYYDFIRVDDTHLGLAIADVSGKGITGAIMMSICRSTLRAQATESPDPVHVLRNLNRILSQDVQEDMFISILYMVLDTATRELKVARAGHERPILCSGNNGGFTFIDSPGVAIGIWDPGAFDQALGETTVQLKPGDVVVAYTDGVTEAMNRLNEEWGMESFLEAIRITAAEGANSVLNNVRRRLERFVGEQPQYDDMTLLSIRILR